MRKFVLALAAVAAVGTAIPVFATTSAEARHRGHVVVIKKQHHDNGRHLGWYKHNRHHGAAVGVRAGGTRARVIGR